MTPVRVRGKKYRQKPTMSKMSEGSKSTSAARGQHKRAASLTPLPTPSQKKARTADNHSASERVPSPSPLESLPTEILEIIFFYSLNINLPRASLVLGERLASDLVKSNLFLLVFPSKGVFPLECIKLREHDHLISILGTEDAIGKLQSDILASRWASPAFIHDMTKPFLVRTIVREFRLEGLGWLDESDRAKEHNKRVLNDQRNFGRIKQTGVLEATNDATIESVSRFYRRAVTGGRIREGLMSDSKHWLWRIWSTKDMVELFIDFRGAKIFIEAYGPTRFISTEEAWKNGSPYRPLLDFSSRLLYCLPNCRIPSKLLHGPWSDDKCETLERVFRGGGRLDQTGSTMDEEIAEDGLRDAIRQGKPWAIELFVGCITMYSVGGGWERVSEECEHCDHALLTADRAENPCERHLRLYCVGLTVKTDHLKLALDNDCSYFVLHSLLHAMKVEIDWADPQLTAWAVQKRKEDDERGQWLLDRINSSNRVRFEEEEWRKNHQSRQPDTSSGSDSSD